MVGSTSSERHLRYDRMQPASSPPALFPAKYPSHQFPTVARVFPALVCVCTSFRKAPSRVSRLTQPTCHACVAPRSAIRVRCDAAAHHRTEAPTRFLASHLTTRGATIPPSLNHRHGIYGTPSQSPTHGSATGAYTTCTQRTCLYFGSHNGQEHPKYQ